LTTHGCFNLLTGIRLDKRNGKSGESAPHVSHPFQARQPALDLNEEFKLRRSFMEFEELKRALARLGHEFTKSVERIAFKGGSWLTDPFMFSNNMLDSIRDRLSRKLPQVLFDQLKVFDTYLPEASQRTSKKIAEHPDSFGTFRAPPPVPRLPNHPPH